MNYEPSCPKTPTPILIRMVRRWLVGAVVWCVLSIASMAQAEIGQVDVLTYNIRYANAEDAGLGHGWSTRLPRIIELVVELDPDLIAFQEALFSQVKDLEQFLPGYGWYGIGRDDGKKGGEYSPVFYRKDRFELLRSETFWLSSTPETASLGWGATIPRIATHVRLRFKEGLQQEIGFWNTHFDHRENRIREASARLMRQRMEKEIPSLRGLVILAGDLNTKPGGAAYREIETFLRDSRKISTMPPEGPEGTSTGWNHAEPAFGRIDYIWSGLAWEVAEYRTIPTPEDGFLRSDHLPVWVRLRWAP